MNTGLLIGAALAIVALSWVMAPLLRGRATARPPVPGPAAVAAPVVADPALDDAAEEAIRRWRTREASCAECGVRPERDATFCSNCGRFLGDRCPHCGAAATNRKSRYCAECGESLAG